MCHNLSYKYQKRILWKSIYSGHWNFNGHLIARDNFYESLMIVFWAKALENTQNKASNTTEVAANLTEKPHQCVVVKKWERQYDKDHCQKYPSFFFLLLNTIINLHNTTVLWICIFLCTHWHRNNQRVKTDWCNSHITVTILSSFQTRQKNEEWLSWTG